MWTYEKRLQYPVNIKTPNAATAKFIITQFGGPDGELAASQRYLSQRYVMPYNEVKGILTDIGTEELAHMEIICAIVHQLTRNLTIEEIKASGFDSYFVDIPLDSGLRQQAELLLVQPYSSQKVIRLQTFMRIWQQSRKPEPPMTISFV